MSSQPIDKDEFEAWLAHPVTQALFAKCRRVSDGLEQRWLRESWGRATDFDGELAMRKLALYRGKADAFASVLRLKYDDLFGLRANDNGREDIASPVEGAFQRLNKTGHSGLPGNGI